jgi:hypothetical protein
MYGRLSIRRARNLYILSNVTQALSGPQVRTRADCQGHCFSGLKRIASLLSFPGRWCPQRDRIIANSRSDPAPLSGPQVRTHADCQDHCFSGLKRIASPPSFPARRCPQRNRIIANSRCDPQDEKMQNVLVQFKGSKVPPSELHDHLRDENIGH